MSEDSPLTPLDNPQSPMLSRALKDLERFARKTPSQASVSPNLPSVKLLLEKLKQQS